MRDRDYEDPPPVPSVLDIQDRELVWRVMRSLRPRPKVQRWVAVMETFLLGSTYAHQLCLRFGLDPEERI